MDGLPQEQYYNLTHYHQRFNWDCGISCILMILSGAQRQNFLDNFPKICEEEGFGTSTWTIDLCFLLHRYKVRHDYFTKTIGIDPIYRQHDYYTALIDKDNARVTHKFKVAATTAGLNVQQRVIAMDDILNHLAHHGPVILLTNASLLTCNICQKNILEKIGFAGHYVVLCGYDLRKNRIYYHNPDVQDKHVCYGSIEAMDTARKAFGTDEDVILIYQD